MTTIAQVKRLVRPLLERHADLVLIGRDIVVAPVRHLLRAVVIDRTLAAEQFAPRYAVTFLFEPAQAFNLGWGARL